MASLQKYALYCRAFREYSREKLGILRFQKRKRLLKAWRSYSKRVQQEVQSFRQVSRKTSLSFKEKFFEIWHKALQRREWQVQAVEWSRSVRLHKLLGALRHNAGTFLYLLSHIDMRVKRR